MEAVSRPGSERAIGIRQLQEYLRRHGYPDALLTAVAPLTQPGDASLKSYGYGRPLRISFTSRGQPHDVVLRTMRPDPFGHDRRADRLQLMTLAYDTFDALPGHARALDLGAFDEAGNLLSLPRGEPFLVTEFAPGSLYAKSLTELAGQATPSSIDLARAELLARYLAVLHEKRAEAGAYVRSVRDLVGHGEGIFGLTDSYPSGAVPEGRLQAIEAEVVAWRWRLKAKVHRARRIHGDFHPFNLVFDEGTALSVLDARGGGAGDPAEDVTCLAVNYLFFALAGGDEGFSGALRALWRAFWSAYLAETGDGELLEVAAPFVTRRILVLASPVWYPKLTDGLRDRLLTVAERLLAGAALDPDAVDRLLR